MTNTLSAKQSRNVFIDIIKAFAIILVVIGHCIQYGAGKNFLQEKLFFDNNIFKIIYSFHMPLFMLISGYLFAYGRNKSIKDVFIGRFKSLVIPILCWNIIPITHHIIQLVINSNFSTLAAIKYIIEYNIGSFWFLWAVFGCSCIIILVNKLCNDNLLVYATLFLITFVIPDDFNLHLYKYMYPFFLAGYFYNKKNLKEKWKNIYNKKYVAISLATLFLILLQFSNRNSYIYTSGYTLLERDWTAQLGIDLYRFVIGFVGSAFAIVSLYRIYNIAKVREWIANSGVLLTIGQNTMGIYIISTFINTLILMVVTKPLAGINYGLIIIETAGVTALSLLITKAIQRSRFLNKYLLGHYKRIG